MDINIANAVGGYFETLYDVNVKLIKLCGIDVFSPYGNDEIMVLDIIQDVYRLFPYKFDKVKNVLMLDNNGGLLEFKETFVFLEKDFSDILETNNKFLDSIRKLEINMNTKCTQLKLSDKAVDLLRFSILTLLLGENI